MPKKKRTIVNQEQHSFEFLGFELDSQTYLKTLTKQELIDYIYMVYDNWSGIDIMTERVRKLGIETYRKLLINREALKVYENHVEMMDEKLDEWEQGERK